MKIDRFRHGLGRRVRKEHEETRRTKSELRGWVDPPAIDARDLGEIRALLGGPLEAKRPSGAGVPRFEPLVELPPAPLSPLRRDRLPEPEGVLQGWWHKGLELIQGRGSLSEISRARRLVGQVRDLEPRFGAMSDRELRAQTAIFRDLLKLKTAPEASVLEAAERALASAAFEDRAELGERVRAARVALYKVERKVLDAILPEAFATVREAGRRATGMYPFEVQVLAGALMDRGMAAEMYTGEGKTLAATMPAYLNALAGHGFHVVTVNDYLAKRDAEEMSAIYGFLGMTVGVLQNNQRQLQIDPPAPKNGNGARPEPRAITRKDAYACDITYATASELGFDYLRDNGVSSLSDRVQRPLSGALIDEVDAILIDEARTPLIIAQQGADPDAAALIRFRDIAERLDWKPADDGEIGDVEWNQKENWVSLTDRGEEKVARFLGVENLFTTENMDQLRQVYDALQARFLLRADEDYAVIDDKVVTIGKNGHALAGRRFTRGLHQAIEAKENVEILPDTPTRASVTMRDYFAMYALTSGMTGTALSARDLLAKVYGLEVARVPTREKLIRIDHPDLVFRTKAEKKAAFLEDVERAHRTGRPILVGVEWTSTAEDLAKDLRARGLPVEVLTAKDDDEEARIIANAGRIGAITVVTTRGGRGVDIKLGGNARIIAESIVKQGGRAADEAYQKAAAESAKERARVLKACGLLVMGYEHLDSRRRDDQLRGRAGRQGDPGGDDLLHLARGSALRRREGRREDAERRCAVRHPSRAVADRDRAHPIRERGRRRPDPVAAL